MSRSEKSLPFFSRFYAFSRISPTFLIGEWLFSSVGRSNGYVGHLGPCWAIYYQRWLNIADPTSLDVLVVFRILDQLTSRGVVQYCRPFAGVVQITMRDVSRIKPNVNNATCWGTWKLNKNIAKRFGLKVKSPVLNNKYRLRSTHLIRYIFKCLFHLRSISRRFGSRTQ